MFKNNRVITRRLGHLALALTKVLLGGCPEDGEDPIASSQFPCEFGAGGQGGGGMVLGPASSYAWSVVIAG
jgi:hypothetical protein